MSKKLLMNSFSSGSSGGLSPVQDGLMCWLDAFDLTTYEYNTIWEDRSSYKNNGVVSAIYEAATITNGVLNAKSVLNIPNPTKGLNNYTVEIGYEDIAKKYWCGLWGNTSGKNGIIPDGISFYQQNNQIGRYPLEKTLVNKNGIEGGKNYLTFVFTVSNFKLYHNGILLVNLENETNITIEPSNANYLCFMARKVNTVDENTTNGADMIKNNWYFIRIYNRSLTEQEIINNYNYELSLARG